MIALAMLVSLFHLWLAAALGPGLGVGLDGRTIESLGTANTRAVVLFFTASDCPIANRYLPEIERLARDGEQQGVAVWFVYPNPSDTADAVRSHQARFALAGNAGNVILDTRHTLVSMAHATVTPEAAVFVPDGSRLREVYHGRLDDRYAALGKERPQAMHHDLEDAVRSVLAGQPVPSPGGRPIGCAIMPVGPAPRNQ